MIQVRYNGKVYCWDRFGRENAGRWMQGNCIVALYLDAEITKAARAAGITEKFDFAYIPPKPKYEKAVRGPGKSSGNTRTRTGKTAVRICVSNG